VIRIVIASDFHLKYIGNEEDNQRFNRVCCFLKSLKENCEVLILNGDIFDLWIEWNTVIIKDYFPILKILSDLKESGIRIIMVTGNHDFWFGNFLSQTIGIELYQDFFSETIGLNTFYVTHGDLHTVNDIRYQIFRRIIRSFPVKVLVKCIHPTLSLYLGTSLSRSSRNRKDSPDLQQKKEKGLIRFAEKMINDFQTINQSKSLVVAMGHSHQPKLIPIKQGWYVNSGDWIKHKSYCIINQEKIEIRYYESS